MTRPAKPLPYLSRLNELFFYDPKTGELIRRIGKGGEVAGSIVGVPNSHGHLICRVDYAILYVHRIAWFLHYKNEPPPIIDHVNGDPSDNRISNLRAATKTENHRNSRGRKTSKSKIKGVHWSSLERKWRSSIGVDGCRIHLGWFINKEDAAKAYAKAAHKYHGEFARTA